MGIKTNSGIEELRPQLNTRKGFCSAEFNGVKIEGLDHITTEGNQYLEVSKI